MSVILKKTLSLLLTAGLALGVGCSPESTRLKEAPKDRSEKVDDGLDADDFFAPKVDILFVIDNSGSMSTHQANLANNINLFVSGIMSNDLIDWRIGVTTTDDDAKGGTLIPIFNGLNYVDQATQNGDLVLRNLLRVGINGSYREQMFNPVFRAFTSPLDVTTNKGFLRQDAFLAVVFITDAEDQSDETYPHMSPQGLIQFLDQLKGRGKWLAYGAYLPPGPANCSRDEWGDPVRLHSFFTMTNSQYFDLCGPDFGRNLGSIGSNLAKKVGRTIFLTRWPKVETIKVTYGTQVIPPDYKKGWYYKPDENSITFGEELELIRQAPGTRVKITFVTKQ